MSLSLFASKPRNAFQNIGAIERRDEMTMNERESNYGMREKKFNHVKE
jgi:hypothetical protein